MALFHRFLSALSTVTDLALNARFARYILAGGINTFVAFAVYSGLVYFNLAPYWIANFLGVSASLISGTLIGNYFVFKTKKAPSQTIMLRYVMLYFLQYLLGTILIGVLISAGLGKISAYIVALPFMVLVGYLGQSYWVFRQ